MNKTNKHVIRSRLHVWWWKTSRPDNMATILAVLPYAGRFPQHFDCLLRLAAENTRSGFVEMAYQSEEYKYRRLF